MNAKKVMILKLYLIAKLIWGYICLSVQAYFSLFFKTCASFWLIREVCVHFCPLYWCFWFLSCILFSLSNCLITQFGFSVTAGAKSCVIATKNHVDVIVQLNVTVWVHEELKLCLNKKTHYSLEVFLFLSFKSFLALSQKIYLHVLVFFIIDSLSSCSVWHKMVS